MSKAICTDAINGAREVVARAEEMLAQAIGVKGAAHAVGFPDTAYYLAQISFDRGRRDDAKQLLQAALKNEQPFYKRTDAEALLERIGR